MQRSVSINKCYSLISEQKSLKLQSSFYYLQMHETKTHIPKLAFGSTKRNRKLKALTGNF